MTEGKRAILVLGAESSGTRFVTEILIEAGAEGEAKHKQKWDTVIPVEEELIVWRKSMPHNHCWSFIEDLANDLRIRDYKVQAIVTMRDWCAIMNSQEGKHVHSKEKALENTRRAYEVIFSGLANMNVDYWIFSYEGAVNRGLEYVNKFLEDVGLRKIEEFDIRQENDKYYKKVDNNKS